MSPVAPVEAFSLCSVKATLVNLSISDQTNLYSCAERVFLVFRPNIYSGSQLLAISVTKTTEMYFTFGPKTM